MLDFTEAELLADHRVTERLVADGRICHGGFDDAGNYVSQWYHDKPDYNSAADVTAASAMCCVPPGAPKPKPVADVPPPSCKRCHRRQPSSRRILRGAR